MATDAAAKVSDANLAIADAIAEGTGGRNFRDKAQTANNKLRLAVRAATADQAYLLDEGLAPLKEMPAALQVFLEFGSKPLNKNVVMANLKALLERPHWQYAVSQNQDVLKSLKDFFGNNMDMAAIFASIEAGVEMPPVGPQAPVTAPTVQPRGGYSSPNSSCSEDVLGDMLRCVDAMRELDFKCHKGTGKSIVLSDEGERAFEGFRKAVTRAENLYLAPMSNEPGPRNTTALEECLGRIEPDFPRIMDWFVDHYQHKSFKQTQVKETVIKLGTLCNAANQPRWQAILDERSTFYAIHRLPWMNGLDEISGSDYAAGALAFEAQCDTLEEARIKAQEEIGHGDDLFAVWCSDRKQIWIKNHAEARRRAGSTHTSESVTVFFKRELAAPATGDGSPI